MKHLTEAEFRSTLGNPMKRISLDAEPTCDIWSYFEKIPVTDFNGYDCSAGAVDYAWNDPSGKYQHVLVNSTQKNVFMVIIIDLRCCAVLGHRILDLNHEYGIGPDSNPVNLVNPV